MYAHTYADRSKKDIYTHRCTCTCTGVSLHIHTHTGSAYDMLLFKNIKIYIIPNAHTGNLWNTKMTKKKNMYVYVSVDVCISQLYLLKEPLNNDILY